jgi:uncharacterized membrane protein
MNESETRKDSLARAAEVIGAEESTSMGDRAEAADSRAQPNPNEALSDLIAQNISDIIELESKELESITGARRWLEAVSRRIAGPAYLVGLLIFVGAWIAINVYRAPFNILRFDPPPFHWLEGLLTLTALLTTTIVLIGQARQSKLAEQRAHLDLQINLLTEQKVTKLIHLLEELRTDLPGVRERHDPHVSQLKEPTDAAQLASALRQQDAGGGAPTSSKSRD